MKRLFVVLLPLTLVGCAANTTFTLPPSVAYSGQPLFGKTALTLDAGPGAVTRNLYNTIPTHMQRSGLFGAVIPGATDAAVRVRVSANPNPPSLIGQLMQSVSMVTVGLVPARITRTTQCQIELQAQDGQARRFNYDSGFSTTFSVGNFDVVSVVEASVERCMDNFYADVARQQAGDAMATKPSGN